LEQKFVTLVLELVETRTLICGHNLVVSVMAVVEKRIVDGIFVVPAVEVERKIIESRI
jgi:hypothetical protein